MFAMLSSPAARELWNVLASTGGRGQNTDKHLGAVVEIRGSQMSARG